MMPTAPNPFLAIKVRSLFFWGLVFFISIGFALGLILGFLGLLPNDPVLILIIYVLLFTALCLWFNSRLTKEHGNWRYLLGKIPNQRRSQRTASLVKTAGLVLAALMFSIGSFQLVFYPLSLVAPTYVQSVLRELAESGNPPTAIPWLYDLLNVVAAIVVAPIAEEILFRGFILQRWATKWNLPAGLIVSSALFGAMHPNPVGLTMFGLLMGMLYLKTRSLLVPIACHALNNAVATASSLLPKSANPDVLTLTQLRSGLEWSVLLVALSAPSLIQFMVKNFPRRNAQIPYLLNQAELESDYSSS